MSNKMQLSFNDWNSPRCTFFDYMYFYCGLTLKNLVGAPSPHESSPGDTKRGNDHLTLGTSVRNCHRIQLVALQIPICAYMFGRCPPMDPLLVMLT